VRAKKLSTKATPLPTLIKGLLTNLTGTVLFAERFLFLRGVMLVKEPAAAQRVLRLFFWGTPYYENPIPGSVSIREQL
jgi:hypothetical protein